MKRTPLARKTSLRDAYIKKLKQRGQRSTWNCRTQTLKTKKPLKKVSKSQRNRLKRYYAIQQEFLSRPENALCAICEARRAHGEDIPQQAATEVHHRASRSGAKLFDTSDFVASCYGCRLFPHEHPKIAREWNLLR